MLVIPAIDLKDGQCVRLKQGDMGQATTFSEDPAAMVRREAVEEAGLEVGELIRIHVVNAGPTIFSAFHVIGTLFSAAYADGNPANKQVGMQTVTIPPGIEHGATRLVERAGNVTRPDRPPGDLELTISVAPHPFFRRAGDDVVCSVPIAFSQAALGAEVEVPTLDGKGKLRIPAGTQPGSVLRIKGRGMPHRVRSGRGDQLVEVTVEVPTTLTARQRELLEELARELGEDVQPQQRSFVEKLRDLFG